MNAPGSVQMAIDTWLFNQHLAGNHPPTLRFYTWSVPSISLGCHQTRFPTSWRSLTWQGKPVELVRRPTGGRAVLHQGDLTYGIVTSGLSQNRQAAYGYLCEFLIQGWQSLGMELTYGQADRTYFKNPNCFGTKTAADLILENGAKLIGSAQLRRATTVLQHGSIRLAPDPTLWRQVFGEASSHQPRLSLPWQGEDLLAQLVSIFSQTAQAHFQMNLVAQPLTPPEWQEVLKCVAPPV